MFIFLPNRCFTLCQTQWKLKSKSGLKYTKCYDSTGSILIGLKDGNNSIFVMFNVSENKENLLLVPRSTLKKTSKVTRHFTLSTQESSVWAFYPNSGANKNTSNLPAACIFFFVFTASLHMSVVVLNQNKHAAWKPCVHSWKVAEVWDMAL